METVIHVAKLVSLALVVSAILAILGGMLLRVVAPPDVAELGDDERPIDYVGRRS